MRVVVAQTSFLGDVVLSTPVFAALKRHWPEAELTAWVRPEAAAILDGHPHVDAVLIDDKRGAERGLGGLARLCGRLRAGRFDIAVALHRSLRTAVLLALARVPQRIGFRQSGGWFLYHRCVWRDASRHDVERNLSILSGLAIDPGEQPPRPCVVSPTDGRADALLREAGVPANATLVALAPGSAWATKRWTPSGYAAAALGLHTDGLHVILLGTPGERAITEEVNRLAGGIATDLAGRTDVALLISVIDRCRLLVCNDSAPMHIAAARGVPVVAIFGPTHPRQGYGPYTERAVVLQRDLKCRPCGRHGGARCPIGTHECMREIEPAAVLSAARTLLDSQRPGIPRAVAS